MKMQDFQSQQNHMRTKTMRMQDFQLQQNHMSKLDTILMKHYLLPPANRVCGKVIFLHVCVILSTGGGCVRLRTPLDYIPPPLGLRTPRLHTPLGLRTPPTTYPPGLRTPRGRSMCGRYASYWNAFLLLVNSGKIFGKNSTVILCEENMLS